MRELIDEQNFHVVRGSSAVENFGRSSKARSENVEGLWECFHAWNVDAIIPTSWFGKIRLSRSNSSMPCN